MPHYPYLIIGGGMTAAAAIHGIREVDPTGAIGVIGLDPHPPYQRPPLSKALWKGASEKDVWIDIAQQNVELILGRQAQTLDAEHKRVGGNRAADACAILRSRTRRSPEAG